MTKVLDQAASRCHGRPEWKRSEAPTTPGPKLLLFCLGRVRKLVQAGVRRLTGTSLQPRSALRDARSGSFKHHSWGNGRVCGRALVTKINNSKRRHAALAVMATHLAIPTLPPPASSAWPIPPDPKVDGTVPSETASAATSTAGAAGWR